MGAKTDTGANLGFEAKLWAAADALRNKMLVRARKKAERYEPQDFVKDPYVLEFLGLNESPSLSETKLEKALLNHLQEFLLEMGKGFCFVARQQRITMDGDHFYIDLLFYNRLLRCFVLIDLKVGKLTHQDIGQMQLCVFGTMWDFSKRCARCWSREPRAKGGLRRRRSALGLAGT